MHGVFLDLRFKKDDRETNQLSNESGTLNRKYHDNTAKYKGIICDGSPNKTTAEELQAQFEELCGIGSFFSFINS